MHNPKIISFKQAISRSEQLRNAGKKTVLITGCFDVIHHGHVHFFEYAKMQGDILFVGLDNDQNIALNKGEGRPLFRFDKRASVLAALKSTDYIFKIEDVVQFNSLDADHMLINIISKLKPYAFVSHQSGDATRKRKSDICKKTQSELHYRQKSESDLLFSDHQADIKAVLEDGP